MVRMIAPNGVEVDASALDEPLFLSCGYKYAQDKEQPEESKKRTRKRTTKAVQE